MTIDRSLTRAAARPRHRRARTERLMPGAQPWTARSYSRTPVAWPPLAAAAHAAGTVEAVRFAVTGPVALRATHGVLIADEIHRLVVRELDGGRAEVIGHAGAPNNHTHAHWVPLPTGEVITSLLLWVPARLSTVEVTAVLTAALPGIGGRRSRPPTGYDMDRLPRLHLHLQSAGPAATVAPELCGPARVWRSLTPYLPVRHRKRAESLADYLTQDVRRELAYRDQPPAAVRRLSPEDEPVDRWAAAFRRCRTKERRDQRRPGYGLRLEFDEPRPGPLLLGQLSHFGFGDFVPESGDR